MNTAWKKPTEFADYMGMSRRTIWRWMEMGLPYAKIGGTRLISIEQADAWINDHVQRDDNDRFSAIVEELTGNLK